jgi:hypothetical protein
MLNCDDKARLVDEYARATAKLLDAIKLLQSKMGTSPKDEYERLDRAANEDRVRSETARLALETHVAAHRC